MGRALAQNMLPLVLYGSVRYSLSSAMYESFLSKYPWLFQPSSLITLAYSNMSLSSLTNEELVLYRYAAVVKIDLKVYHQLTFRDEGFGRQTFEKPLVHLYILSFCFISELTLSF